MAGEQQVEKSSEICFEFAKEYAKKARNSLPPHLDVKASEAVRTFLELSFMMYNHDPSKANWWQILKFGSIIISTNYLEQVIIQELENERANPDHEMQGPWRVAFNEGIGLGKSVICGAQYFGAMTAGEICSLLEMAGVSHVDGDWNDLDGSC